jgi:hypothetical protein
MKNLRILTLFLLSMVIFTACEKDETKRKGSANVSVQTQDYIFNIGNKGLSPADNIDVNIKSDVGVESIYAYLIRSNKADSLISIIFPGENDNIKDLNISFENSLFLKPDMSQVKGIKVMVRNTNKAAYEGFVTINPFFPDLPNLTDFSSGEQPDDNSKVIIEGKASSENGISKIEILHDATGPYTVVQTYDNLNGVKNYDVNYTYTHDPEANNIQIVLYDNEGYTTSRIVKILTVPYILRKDIVMNAQGDATSNSVSAWVNDMTWSTFGSCDLHALSKNNSEVLKDVQRIAFLFYGTSSLATFYAPSGAGNIAKNYICGSAEWGIPPADVSTFKATRFRSIVRAQNAATEALYANIESGNISTLDNTFFTGISNPSSTQARYVESPADNVANDYNTTNRNIVWVKVPKESGGDINVILRIKEVSYATANPKFATVKFDMYVQK